MTLHLCKLIADLSPQLVTPEQLQQLYRRALREAESSARNSYHCKTTNCEGFCFYEDEVNEFHCPICRKVSLWLGVWVCGLAVCVAGELPDV